MVRSQAGIEILERGNRVLFYRAEPDSPQDKYRRGGYIHPLYGMKGEVLTEDFPADHPYHHGVFWTWHQVVLNGKKIADGWVGDHIKWMVGKVTATRTKKVATIRATVIWTYVDSITFKESALIKEQTLITIHAEKDHRRLIDLEIQLHPLQNHIALGGSEDAKGYGGFCLRLKLPGDITFNSGQGRVEPQETAVEAAPWMIFTGSFDARQSPKSSIVLFRDAGSSNQLQKWILRKQSSMQNIVYPGNIPRELPVSGWKLKYHLLLSRDELNKEQFEKIIQ